MFVVDAHLDLAYNALNLNRNLSLPLSALRETEPDAGLGRRGRATVSLPALRDAGVGLVFATLFVDPADSPLPNVDGNRIVYRTADEAHQQAMRHLDYYHRLADEHDWIRMVGDLETLETVVASHEEGSDPLLGLVPLMEGAAPIREPQEAELWAERGLRLIGLAWDDTPYSPGAWRGGGRLTKEGRQLLEVMADLGLILDLTHMSEEAIYDALDAYEGHVVATHANARALVPGMRQLPDAQIRRLAERDGMVGIVLYNAMLRADYRRGEKESAGLEHVVAHVDHICQLVCDAAHVGIGSDLDGGFGAADIPREMDSIADLPLIAGALKERGYTPADITAIMSDNWLNLLRRAL